MTNGEIILPSDMELREDLPPMIAKDWKEAEVAKNKMEDQQRKDYKLREAAAARRKATQK